MMHDPSVEDYIKVFLYSELIGVFYIYVDRDIIGKGMRVYIVQKKTFQYKKATLALAKAEGVEVYGALYGKNEQGKKDFGWLHHGKWIKDFNTIYDYRKFHASVADQRRKYLYGQERSQKEKRIKSILDSYK